MADPAPVAGSAVAVAVAVAAAAASAAYRSGPNFPSLNLSGGMVTTT